MCSHRASEDEVKRDSVEMVTASGAGKVGKLCVLQRSLNPTVSTAVSLPEAQAVWTGYGPPAEEEEEEGHEFMVISIGGDEPKTVVLKGRELEEFDDDEQMDFFIEGATVCVANIFNRRRIVQVA